MPSKKPEDLLQILDNHIFFNEITEERLDIFFNTLLKKFEILKYDENNVLITSEKEIKQRMAGYLANDCKLLLDNIPKAQLIISTNMEIKKEQKPILLRQLEEKVSYALEQIKSVVLDDIINDSYDRIFKQ